MLVKPQYEKDVYFFVKNRGGRYQGKRRITKILNSEENSKGKSLIKWHYQNLKHIKRMDTNCRIPDFWSFKIQQGQKPVSRLFLLLCFVILFACELELQRHAYWYRIDIKVSIISVNYQRILKKLTIWKNWTFSDIENYIMAVKIKKKNVSRNKRNMLH